MPACPRCQTPYEPGARFCQQCGSFLLDPEPTRPDNGPARTQLATAGSDAPQPPSSRLNIRLLALLGGAGVILLILAVFLFTRTSTPPPETRSQAQKPAASAPEASLQEQVAHLLGALREAQVNKDISRLMSCYATSFPEREQKRRDALKAWQDFDFTAMFFIIEDLRSEGPEAAQAKVTWDLQVQDKRTREFLTSTQTYRVDFIKEQGAWRIRSLEEINVH